MAENEDFTMNGLGEITPMDLKDSDNVGDWIHITTTRIDGVLRIFKKEKIKGKWYDVETIYTECAGE